MNDELEGMKRKRNATLQTFSYGTNFHHISAVQLAVKKLKNTNAGMKKAQSLYFGTNVPTKSVCDNIVLDENYCFSFILNHLKYSPTIIPQNMMLVGHDQGTMIHVGRCPFLHSFSTRHRQ